MNDWNDLKGKLLKTPPDSYLKEVLAPPPKRIDTRYYLIQVGNYCDMSQPYPHRQNSVYIYLDNGETNERIDTIKVYNREAADSCIRYIGLELGKRFGNKVNLVRLAWHSYKATFTDAENVPDKIEFWKEENYESNTK